MKKSAVSTYKVISARVFPTNFQSVEQADETPHSIM